MLVYKSSFSAYPAEDSRIWAWNCAKMPKYQSSINIFLLRQLSEANFTQQPLTSTSISFKAG